MRQRYTNIHGQTVSDEQRVRGFVPVPGLGVFREDGTWYLCHLASGDVLTHLDHKKKAIALAKAIAPLLDWTRPDIPDVLQQGLRLRDYLKAVREAIAKKAPLPPIPEELALVLPFYLLPHLAPRAETFLSSYRQLMGLIGLEEIKKQIQAFVEELRGEVILESKGVHLDKRQALHMMFLGPPGTGKTTVARLLGTLLYAVGKLEKPTVVEVDRSTLVGPYIGHTEQRTRAAIQEALGGILFIDEAYALAQDSDNDFGREANTVLIKAMEDFRDRLVVIFAGYEGEMAKLQQLNPGLMSRIAHVFRFRNYTPKELALICTHELRTYKLHVPDETVAEIERTLVALNPTGNGRATRTLAETILREFKIRIGRSAQDATVDLTVLPEDVEKTRTGRSFLQVTGQSELVQEALQELENLIGLDQVKEQARTILNYMVGAAERAKQLPDAAIQRPNLHMVFYGPPGTGKTTVARIMAKFLYGTGLLSTGTFIEADRSRLVGKWQGHTARQVEEVFQQAMGGVLFIDEAYALVQSEWGDTFGHEAVDTLIKLMEDYRHEVCVILAGYENEMDAFLESNPGFRSRIGHSLYFPPYSAEELLHILFALFQRHRLEPDDAAKTTLTERVYAHAKRHSGHIPGNARWARNLFEKILLAQSNRIAQTGEKNSHRITAEDVDHGFQAQVHAETLKTNRPA
ncbi:MAG: AAA family ATPase [Calditerricola sp.]|nr:AAA family ATPase [Calditerricola sp.]